MRDPACASAVICCAPTRTQFYASPKWSKVLAETEYPSEVDKRRGIYTMRSEQPNGRAPERLSISILPSSLKARSMSEFCGDKQFPAWSLTAYAPLLAFHLICFGCINYDANVVTVFCLTYQRRRSITADLMPCGRAKLCW